MPINLQGSVKKLGDGHTVTVINAQGKQSSHLCSQFPGDDERPSICPRDSCCFHVCERHIYHPILPWINGDGSMNSTVYEGLSRRIIGYIMQYPGIMEVCLFLLTRHAYCVMVNLHKFYICNWTCEFLDQSDYVI
jgi:general transcription factor 3C polypeptide 1